MINNATYIENSAQKFWEEVDGAINYPCDMEVAITFTLPLEVLGIDKLRVSDINAWAERAGILHYVSGRDRRLHGCLLADKDNGVIFYDADDPFDEQRVTLSHELAHFLVDYKAPRERAIRIFGPAIVPILDGERPPTSVERLHSVLSTVHLGSMSHIMERPDEGIPSTVVLDIEDRADRLALELLAPASLLCERMQQSTARGFKARLAFLTQYLFTVHGLPERIASSYARHVLHQMGEPTFRDALFHRAG